MRGLAHANSSVPTSVSPRLSLCRACSWKRSRMVLTCPRMPVTGRKCSRKSKTRLLHGLLSIAEELYFRVGLHTGQDSNLCHHALASNCFQQLYHSHQCLTSLIVTQRKVQPTRQIQATWCCDAAAPPTQQSMHWPGTSTALA